MIEKSLLYARGVVLRDPLTQQTTGRGFNSRSAAIKWCRQNGWFWMD